MHKDSQHEDKELQNGELAVTQTEGIHYISR